MEASPDQVLTKTEAAIWLRLADPESDPGELASACRAVKHLVQQRRIKPLKAADELKAKSAASQRAPP